MEETIKEVKICNSGSGYKFGRISFSKEWIGKFVLIKELSEKKKEQYLKKIQKDEDEKIKKEKDLMEHLEKLNKLKEEK